MQGVELTGLTENLQGRDACSVSGNRKRATFLRTGVGELQVAEVLTRLPTKGLFKEKQCYVGCFLSCFPVTLCERLTTVPSISLIFSKILLLPLLLLTGTIQSYRFFAFNWEHLEEYPSVSCIIWKIL